MEFEEFTVEQYRSLDATAFEERRSFILDLCSDDECKVDAETLRAEAAMIRAEAERRNTLMELRSATIKDIAQGAGSVVSASTVQRSVVPAAEVDRFDTPEYRSAFMNYFTRGAAMPAEYIEQRADESTQTTDVPIMVPTTLMNQVVEKMSEYGDIWNRVTKMNVQGGIDFPILDLKPTASWIAENEVSDYQKLEATDKVSFKFHQLECRLSQSLLASVTTFAAFQARFVPLVAEAMVRALEQAIVRGSGNGQFLGITVDTRVTNIVTMSAAEFADWKAWRKKVKAAMPKSYRNGEFIMAQSTFDSYIETMSDDNNAPVSIGYNPVTGEEVMRLMGKTATTVEPDILPDFDTAAAGDVVAIFGDLSNYVVNSNMAVSTVRWVDHDKNQVKTKALMAADGKVLDPYGFILIKKGASA